MNISRKWIIAIASLIILVFTNPSKEDIYQYVKANYTPIYNIDVQAGANLFIFSIYTVKIGKDYTYTKWNSSRTYGVETHATKYDHTLKYITFLGNKVQIFRGFVHNHNYRYDRF